MELTSGHALDAERREAETPAKPSRPRFRGVTQHHPFDGYAPRGPAFDEMFASSGTRSAYAHLSDTFGAMTDRDLSARWRLCSPAT